MTRVLSRTGSRIGVACLTLLLALSVAGWAHAESTLEARAWLEKMMGVYEKGPFSVDYSADMHMSQGDQTMSMTMNGQMTQADPKHLRMNISMDMAMPGAGPMEMKTLTVVDGETVWIDMDNPMMGGRRVMKMSYDQAEQMGKGGTGMGDLRNMDPVAQMKEMIDKFDFTLVGETGGEVTLSAPLDPEALGDMGQMSQMTQGQDAGSWTMTLVLDAGDGVPKEVRMGAEGDPMMTIRFSDWQFHGAAGAPAGSFEYAPPEGVQVMDLGEMMTGQGEGGGQ